MDLDFSYRLLAKLSSGAAFCCVGVYRGDARGAMTGKLGQRQGHESMPTSSPSVCRTSPEVVLVIVIIGDFGSEVCIAVTPN